MNQQLPDTDETRRAINILALSDMGMLSGNLVWDAQVVYAAAYNATNTTIYTDPFGGEINLEDVRQIAYEMIDTGELTAEQYS